MITRKINRIFIRRFITYQTIATKTGQRLLHWPSLTSDTFYYILYESTHVLSYMIPLSIGTFRSVRLSKSRPTVWSEFLRGFRVYFGLGRSFAVDTAVLICIIYTYNVCAFLNPCFGCGVSVSASACHVVLGFLSWLRENACCGKTFR